VECVSLVGVVLGKEGRGCIRRQAVDHFDTLCRVEPACHGDVEEAPKEMSR
jgi:hypothetical protein